MVLIWLYSLVYHWQIIWNKKLQFIHVCVYYIYMYKYVYMYIHIYTYIYSIIWFGIIIERIKVNLFIHSTNTYCVPTDKILGIGLVSKTEHSMSLWKLHTKYKWINKKIKY